MNPIRFLKYILAFLSVFSVLLLPPGGESLGIVLALVLIAVTISEAANKAIEAYNNSFVEDEEVEAKSPAPTPTPETATGDQLATSGGGGG